MTTSHLTYALMTFTTTVDPTPGAAARAQGAPPPLGIGHVSWSDRLSMIDQS